MNANYNNNNNVSSNIFATGAAVSQGISSYYQGKSQAQLAKRDPKAYVQLKKQQNRSGLIVFFVFLGLFFLIGITLLIIFLTKPKQEQDEPIENK